MVAKEKARTVAPTGKTRSPNEIDRQIGERIRLARKLVKLSQTELGQAIGVTYQQVQKYENGTDRVAASRLVQISGVLSQAPSFFLEQGADTDVLANLPEGTDALLGAFAGLNEQGRRVAVSLLRTLRADGTFSD